MKTLIIGLAVGAAVGWWLTDDHHITKQLKLEAAQHAAETKRNDAIAQLSTEYYQLYQDAINREPVTTVERVYIKASCDVQADKSAAVGDAGSAGRLELGASANRGFRAVARDAESKYKQCAAQLKAAQSLLRAR